MTNPVSPESRVEQAQERDLATHIFTTSSLMLGLCLTIIRVVRGQRNPASVETIVDDIVAVDALTFGLAIPCCLPWRNGIGPAPLRPHFGPPDGAPPTHRALR